MNKWTHPLSLRNAQLSGGAKAIMTQLNTFLQVVRNADREENGVKKEHK